MTCTTTNTDTPEARLTASISVRTSQSRRKTKPSEHIGVVVGHIIEFLTSATKQLPDMELYTDDIDLKVKDGNISVCLTARNKADTSDHEDEEELLYDGD